MTFNLFPVLDKLEALYELPRNRKRFDVYLTMLQGDKGKGMVLPIAAYNPMAKGIAVKKLKELKELNAEAITAEAISNVNQELNGKSKRVISVVINLVDDVGGSWSNRSTTDYTSKFDIQCTLKRDFCTPYFWSSEDLDAKIISQRVTESLYRCLYVINNGKPVTLEEHVKQESYVTGKTLNSRSIEAPTPWLREFYEQNKYSSDYVLIFNFLYGNEASIAMNYKTFGVTRLAGFDYSKWIEKHLYYQ